MKKYSINKHGHTASITLPAFARKELDLSPEDKVTMKIEDGKLIVEKFVEGKIEEEIKRIDALIEELKVKKESLSKEV